MIVGANNINRARMPSIDPALNCIDMGGAICHHGVLEHVRWARSPGISRDFVFWSRCFARLGPERTVVLQRQISVYNHFGPLIRVRKRVLGVALSWDIRNRYVAKGYVLAASFRRQLPAWLPGAR